MSETTRRCTRKPNPHRKNECTEPKKCPNPEYFVRVGELHDHTGRAGPHPILLCLGCGGEYSANKSDYFTRDDNDALTCCGSFMELVTKRLIYERVHLVGEHGSIATGIYPSTEGLAKKD